MRAAGLMDIGVLESCTVERVLIGEEPSVSREPK